MKALFTVLLVVFLSSFLFAQNVDPFNQESGSSIDGGFGMTWIDGTAFTTFTIAPELAFGKLGIGLNIELLFNNSGGFKFRKTGWDKGAGALRMIRYLRWGAKNDPLYLRVGALQSATLGHGFIMGYYNNDVDYDQRKIGLVVDVDFNRFGIETMTSNLGNLEIIGSRLYVRPLLTTNIPILKNFEVGGSYVTDMNPDNKKDSDDGVFEWGLDIGLPLIQSQIFTSTIYADYAKINNFGDGKAFGIKASIPNVVGLLAIHAKLEKRFLNDQFLPNYFNSLYELERGDLGALEHYNLQGPGVPNTMTKSDYLAYAEKTEGIFGELAGHILGKIKLLGNYQQANGKKNSGILHLEARSKDLVPNVQLKYAYDKVGIDDFKDVRTLDYRSVATAEIGYRTYKYFYVALQYRWNFVYDEAKGSYEPQERFQPKVSFSMDF